MKAEDLQKDSSKPMTAIFTLDQAFDDGGERPCAICAAPTRKYADIGRHKAPLCAGHMNVHAARDMAVRLGHETEEEISVRRNDDGNE